jgi:predicted transcriptional regulator
LIARLESEKSRLDPTLSTFLRIKRALDDVERRKITAKGIYHSPVLSVSQSDTLEKAVKIMEKHGISQLPVIDDGFQIGSVSEGAIVRAISTRDIKKDVMVKEIMEEPFPMIPPTTDIGILSHLLESHAAVIVQEKGKLVGIITKHDVMGLLHR